MSITKINDDLIYQGDQREFTMPSGFKIRVRETNGNDDEILSRVGNASDGSSIHKLLAAVIVGCSLYERRVTEEDIISWKVKDKYFAVLASRIHSIGPIMTFKHTFEDKSEFGFEEDLMKYFWDYSKPLPETPNKNLIVPYPADKTEMNGTTCKGRPWKMEYLTGTGELKALGKKQEDLSINEKLRARNFQIQLSNGNWQILENFAMLSTREMNEVRSILDREDPDFMLISEVVNPSNKKIEEINLMGVEDFFFQKV